MCSHAAVKLGQSLFPLFAAALDLPDSFFDDKASVRLVNDVHATLTAD
jgi:isopenicillin N synthase-like dioxygenase